MPVFEKDPDKSLFRLQKRLHQGMVKKVGQMYKMRDDPMVNIFESTTKELDRAKTELAGAILREKQVVKRYQRLVKRVHAFYVSAFHSSEGDVEASELLQLVTKSAQKLNKSISKPAKPKTKNEQSNDHFQPPPEEEWKMSYEWREQKRETQINDSSVAALAILRSRSYDRLSKLQTKLCLLCFSIFPDNCVLKKRLLIYWWIGEGIITAESNKTAEEVGDEIFDELLREGVIVARKDQGEIEDPEGVTEARKDPEGVTEAKKDLECVTEVMKDLEEGVTEARKDYSSCPIANRCSMNPWIRDMLVSVAREACFFDFDPSGKPLGSCTKSLRSCLVSVDPDILFLNIKDSNTPSGHDLKKDGSSSARSPAKSCFPWLLSRDPNNPPSSSSSSHANSSETCLVTHDDQNLPSASSSSHALKTEDSSGTPSDSSAKSCFPCLVSRDPNITPSSSSSTDLKKKDNPKEESSKKREEDLISVFNVSEEILAFETDWLSKLKKVEVLQLGRWQYWCEHHIEVENDRIFKSLGSQKLLKYLSLRGISRISFLPATLSGLVNLVILDLKACHNLEKLPDISSLKKLTHLDLSECYLLESMPEGIAKLTSLQVLKGFVIGNKPRNTRNLKTSKFKDLEKLTKLRRLSIVLERNDEDEGDDNGTLSRITSLRCLTITWSRKKLVKEIKEQLSNQKSKEQDREDPSSKQEPKEPPLKPETKEQLSNHEPKEQEIEELLSNHEPNEQEIEELPSNHEPNHEPKEREIEELPSKPETKEHETEELPSKPETKNPPSKQETKKPVSLPKNLNKLDLRGFPLKKAPEWLEPSKLKDLKKLYLRGGALESLKIDGQGGNGSWGVEILRLKFMKKFDMEISELKRAFPSMKYLEKIDCCGSDIIWPKGV